MLVVKLVILIAKIHNVMPVVTVFSQNSVSPQIIPGTEICPLQEDRDAALQNLHSAALSAMQHIVNNTVIARCGPGQWYHVAYLNMSDPTQQCPSSLRLYSANGVRACGRPSSMGEFSCSSLSFASGDSRQYSKVCGQVIGYQVGGIY